MYYDIVLLLSCSGIVSGPGPSSQSSPSEAPQRPVGAEGGGRSGAGLMCRLPHREDSIQVSLILTIVIIIFNPPRDCYKYYTCHCI